jgi:hypothetical protein
MGSQLPPRYVNVPVGPLYHMDLPASVRTTAIRIYGLGWRQGYERTEPIGLDELLEICEVSRSMLYRHLVTLGAKRVLRYTTVNVGSSKSFVFELLMGARTGRSPPASPGFWTDSTVVVAVVDSSPPEREITPVNKQQQQHSHAVAVGGECERGSGPSRKRDDGLSEILDGLGIVEPTRSELLGLAHVTEPYLEGWLAWYESQEGLGGPAALGLAVLRPWRNTAGHVRAWRVRACGAGAPASRREREAAERRGYLAWGGGGE